MAVSRTNANVAATLLFLAKLRDILTTYFGELEEESLRDNFVIAYELLDEARTLRRSRLGGFSMFLVRAQLETPQLQPSRVATSEGLRRSLTEAVGSAAMHAPRALRTQRKRECASGVPWYALPL